MSKINNYFKETKAELKHVVWPGKRLTVLYTIMVLVISILVAYFLGVFDFIFSKGLEQVITF
jgi:preprotein translocase subunit SecE